MNGPAAVVGFSGGVTSAWCAGWAKRHYPASRITLLFHDTKEEHEDTYRFIREMSEALGMPVTERSDGRSVTQLFRDEGYLGNNQQTFCSRILKAEQGSAFIRDLKSSGETDIHKIIGYSAQEPKRVQRMVGFCANEGITARFPVIEEHVSGEAPAGGQARPVCICEGKPPTTEGGLVALHMARWQFPLACAPHGSQASLGLG